MIAMRSTSFRSIGPKWGNARRRERATAPILGCRRSAGRKWPAPSRASFGGKSFGGKAAAGEERGYAKDDMAGRRGEGGRRRVRKRRASKMEKPEENARFPRGFPSTTFPGTDFEEERSKGSSENLFSASVHVSNPGFRGKLALPRVGIWGGQSPAEGLVEEGRKGRKGIFFRSRHIVDGSRRKSTWKRTKSGGNRSMRRGLSAM